MIPFSKRPAYGTNQGCIFNRVYDDLNLRWFNKFFEGPSIGAVKDSTNGHYQIRIENVSMKGFKYNRDKMILTPEDARPGKWAQELRKWKAARGISVEK